jgi:sec-independent protein translocase protein TatA
MPFVGSIGPLELLIVLGIILLIFGPKRLPAAGRALGHGIREFKDSISGSRKGRDGEDGEDGEPAELPAGPTGASRPSAPEGATAASASPEGERVARE